MRLCIVPDPSAGGRVKVKQFRRPGGQSPGRRGHSSRIPAGRPLGEKALAQSTYEVSLRRRHARAEELTRMGGHGNRAPSERPEYQVGQGDSNPAQLERPLRSRRVEGRWWPDHLDAVLRHPPGELSAAILDALPDVRLQLVDIDPDMLDVAAARCAAHTERLDLRRGRFDDPFPRCHAVVASLALHHVVDHDEKRDLYHTILTALEAGGLVVVGDMLVSPDGPERGRILQDCYRHMERHGITTVKADAHFAQWAQEDHYVSLPDDLALMADAGFPRPECFWRDGGIPVYGGFKGM